VKRAVELAVAAIFFLSLVGCGAATAPAEAPPTGWGNAAYVFWWLVGVGGAGLALWQAWQFFRWMEAQPAGTQKMIDIAGYVRTGADAYLKQQYKVVGWAFLAICLLLLWMALGLGVQSLWVPFAFLSGGLFSGLAGWFGMKTATLASNRTAAGAERSLNDGLQIAFRAGAVMGLTVVGLGLLDIMLWFFILYWLVPMLGFTPLSLEEITVTMLCFGMGASTQALFARVGGGIFTKAADVGADLVGKVEHSIPEDDPRNPATIADNVGDNVGDVAGMGADLYESYCGSILATAALGVAAFSGDGAMQLNAVFLPMAIAAVGTLLSVWGIYQVRTREDSSQKNLLAALATGINWSTGAIVGATFLLAPLLLGWRTGSFGVAISVVVGLLAGWLIGKWTEYATSNEYAPTKELADQALTGPATIIIGGVAEGMLSTWAPVLITGAATLLAFGFANGFNFTDPNAFALGLYGVGIAAVGMLSTLGITLATDAYGPIADNAGGNAQMAGLPEIVRERTDALDALGNTTAATGKGFAIGSAALTALALLAAYVEEVRIGFERWGHASVVTRDNVQEVAAGGRKLAAGDWVKMADRLVLAVGEKAHDNRVYMVLDPAVLNGRKGRDGKEILAPAVKGLQGAVRGAVAEAAPTAELIGELVNENRVVDVKKATMQDYMRFYDVTLMNPKVLVGMFIGAMSVFVFCALTMKAVGRAAKGMVEEVRRQFREKPGIMAGTELPDYAAPVAISTKAAQKEMVLPSVLALAVPVAVGLLLGVSGVLGLLVGGLTTGFCVAVFMANSGGAWDNAKKHIESGVHGGKGSEAHKAAVVGDTVGDPFKDTSGPSLNILVKLMSMVSVVVAGLVVRYSLEAMGIF
jgi:inorganic pyrophosphatase/K(+)-stimulated pyrophosphate-energized sodium pump